jgi:hypothetical protein
MKPETVNADVSVAIAWVSMISEVEMGWWSRKFLPCFRPDRRFQSLFGAVWVWKRSTLRAVLPSCTLESHWLVLQYVPIVMWVWWSWWSLQITSGFHKCQWFLEYSPFESVEQGSLLIKHGDSDSIGFLLGPVLNRCKKQCQHILGQNIYIGIYMYIIGTYMCIYIYTFIFTSDWDLRI